MQNRNVKWPCIHEGTPSTSTFTWTALPLTPTPVPCKLNVDRTIYTFYMHPFWPEAGRTERFTLIYLYFKKHLNRWISKHCFPCSEQSVLTQGTGLLGRLYFVLKQGISKGNTSLSCPLSLCLSVALGAAASCTSLWRAVFNMRPHCWLCAAQHFRTAHNVPAEYLPLPPGELLLQGRHHTYHVCLSSTRTVLCTE